MLEVLREPKVHLFSLLLRTKGNTSWLAIINGLCGLVWAKGKLLIPFKRQLIDQIFLLEINTRTRLGNCGGVRGGGEKKKRERGNWRGRVMLRWGLRIKMDESRPDMSAAFNTGSGVITMETFKVFGWRFNRCAPQPAGETIWAGQSCQWQYAFYCQLSWCFTCFSRIKFHVKPSIG